MVKEHIEGFKNHGAACRREAINSVFIGLFKS
jgi:hypothetical protein